MLKLYINTNFTLKKEEQNVGSNIYIQKTGQTDCQKWLYGHNEHMDRKTYRWTNIELNCVVCGF